VAKSLGRRRIRNVFGVPPAALPREARPTRPPARRRVEPPPFDIDAVRLKPSSPSPRRRR
jgi:hypothetical protein